MPFKISVDKDKCIGCAACVSVCDNFRMEGGISVPIKPTVEDAGCNNQAKETCPVDAISVEEA